MSKNRVSTELTDENKALMIQKFREIADLIPVDLNLSPDERRSLPTLGVKSFGFAQSAFGAVQGNPKFIPNFMDQSEDLKDWNLTRQLKEVMDVADPVMERLEDLFMAVGSEAYLASRIYYDSVKSAAKAGVPGSDVVAKKLGISFKNRGPKSSRESLTKKEDS